MHIKNYKSWIKRGNRKFIYFFNYLIFYFKNYSKGKGVFLISPATLDGSFGDELMVVSFLEANKNKPVTLFCRETLYRNDLFKKYSNLIFLSWNEKINYSLYSEFVLIGADNLTGTYGDSNPIFKFEILKKANRKNINTKIVGFSLKKGISDNIKSHMQKLIPNTVFNLRDIDSFNRAKLFLGEDKVNLVSDLAFLCPYEKDKISDSYREWIDLQRSRKKIVIGVCPNTIQAINIGKERYIEGFAKSLKAANENKNLSFVFLYHDLRKFCDGLSDRDISKNIFDLFDEKENVFFEPNLINGLMLKPYLEFIDFTLTGRMHFGISGYSLGKPMLGITYEDKFSGLQKMFQIDLKSSLVSYTKLEDLSDVLGLFLVSFEEFKANTLKNLDKTKKMSQSNFN